MRELVPHYIKNLQAYRPGKPVEEVARETGLTSIIKLASNENPLGPSPFAIKEMTAGLWDLHHYPDMHAYRLKNSLAELYNLKLENIILGNGSEGIMAYIARCFIQEGDEILTSESSFIGFTILARGMGAKLTEVPMTSDYRYDVSAMKKAISEKTKAIYIANPNNPTGTYITKKEFDSLMEGVPDHCLVILDEAYFEFAREEAEYPDSMDYRYDNVITLRTFSKAYGLAGIRVGYGFAHEDLIAHLSKVKLPFEPNLIAQLGAWGAITDSPHLARTLENNKRLREETMGFLEYHEQHPISSVTNFICFRAEKEDRLNRELLQRGVIIRPLSTHGMPGFMRVSIGTDEEMKVFFSAMEEIMPLLSQRGF